MLMGQKVQSGAYSGQSVFSVCLKVEKVTE